MSAVRRPVPLSEARRDQAARLRTYHGACVCGTFRFAATVDLGTAARCICGRCRGTGLVIVHTGPEGFRILTGEDGLTEPLSDARTPHHFFCARCGEPVFGHVLGPDGDVVRVSVNRACLSRGSPGDLAGVAGEGQ